MIHTDRQLTVTRTELAKLKDAADALAGARVTEAEQWMHDIQTAALRSQMSDMETEIAEYELLRSGAVRIAEMASLEELPRMLVQARIANGMSQTDLAQTLGMKPQQIQRYEASDYMGASLARLIEIANALGVKLANSYGAPNTTGALVSWNDASDIVWAYLPAREMAKRRWFNAPIGQSLVDAARDFIVGHAGPQMAAALHRKKVRSGGAPNAYALLAWQARILALAQEQAQVTSIPAFNLNDSWLPELRRLSQRNDGPSHARALLAEHGIILVIEKHMDGTYLDGAAMLTAADAPVIGLTLRHDRLDNFWFTLMHEIGHVFRHLGAGLRFDFFDEGESAITDTLEREADAFALETLISTHDWDQCMSRFALTEEAVRLDAERLGVGVSVVAGRIRKERNDYMILNSLIGQGQVRAQFHEYAA